MFVPDINYQCCQLHCSTGFSHSEIGMKYNWMQLFSAAETLQIIHGIADTLTQFLISINKWIDLHLLSLGNKITASSLTSNFPTNIN